jgi:hypothetical protein
MLGIGPHLFSSVSAVPLISAAPARSGAQNVSAATPHKIEDNQATFHFDSQIDESFSAAQQNGFMTDFARDLARLGQWSAEQQWPACHARDLQVVVSDKIRISKSLVPAWYGHAGYVEFPTWRVIARRAAITHELVHIFFPNGNRLLAEGLAVYLQAEIGGNPAFPNFGRPLHELAWARLQGILPDSARGDPANLDKIKLCELDKIATPAPLQLRVGENFYGEDADGQAHIYPLVGSFVQCLIETHGLDKFRSLYVRTPLVSLRQDAGRPERWAEIYGVSFAGLEREWKTLILEAANASRTTQPELTKERGNA